MSKKTKQKKAQPSPQKQVKPASKKSSWVWILGAIILGAGAFYYWGLRDNTPGPSFTSDSGAEPTLKAKSPRLELLSPGQTGVNFQNTIVDDNQHNVILNINQYNGGGVAVADYNNDGLPDIYFVSTNGKNGLYINQGNFKFKDIAETAGVSSEDGFETAATAADVNADGWMDIFVCRAGMDEQGREARLFINNGKKEADGSVTFTERAREYGLADKSPCSGANFFDADNDGDLDCYVINHPTDLSHANRLVLKYGADGTSLVPDLDPKLPYDSDNFYRNDDGKFVNASKEAGIQNFGFGLSVSVTDFNADGWPDIYVGNDFVQPDNLFINNKKGGFTDQIDKYLMHTCMSAMGTDISDFDNDGHVDMMTVDMFPTNNYRQKLLKNTNPLSRYLTMVQYGYFKSVARNVLQRNNGNGTFSDIACLSGIYKTDWSWSCLLADLDNDGLKDLHIANGYRREVTNRDYSEFLQPEINKAMSRKNTDIIPYLNKLAEFKVRNFVYQNKGNWQFEDKTGDWMTIPGSWSSGAAWADFDADGDLDLVVNNLEDPAFIYKNLTREQGGGNFIQAKLEGSPKNPFAVGASVLIEYQGLKQYQELNPNHGIFSSVEHLIHFGVGQISQIDKLSVRWPDGKFQVLTNVLVNQRLQLKWSDATGYIAHLIPPSSDGPTLFSEKSPAAVGANFKHTENPFSDFEMWVLSPWSVSDMGPLMAKGDLNGDGLEDFYVGNAFNVPGAIYLQNSNGSFRNSSVAALERDKGFEDQGGLFFDADGDQDLDLFVLSGGVESTLDSVFQLRLYINDGKGNFTRSMDALPNTRDIGLRSAAFDYDQDGDLDIFIGGRIVQQNWPLAPRSIVLRNDQGKFNDVTDQVAGDFERCGMVTDLSWEDIDGDGKKEMIVVGEWMPVSVFKVQNGKLVNATTAFGLDKSNGLWNCLTLADIDKDGDLDFITGNLGLNTRFTASQDAPFYCFAKDFDNNGTLDPIVAFSEKGKIYPLMQKDVLVKQMPVLKKKFLYSKDYAKATISDIWPQKDLDAGLTLYCYTFETCWWENQGGKFVQHKLPIPVQASPIQGIICDDFNGDGNLDILMAGNKYGYEVETNPCDSGTGCLLIGDGKGNFSWMDNNISGFWAMREARDLCLLRGTGGKKTVIVSNNNSTLQIYQ